MSASACEAGGALASLSWMDNVLSLLSPDFRGVLEDAFFYCSVREYVMKDIIQGPYQELVAAKLAIALGVMSATLMTIWVMYQGFQIITGANKNPVVPMFIQTGKMILILSLVSLIAAKSPAIVNTVGDFKALVSESVAEGADITTLIDLNLGISALLNSITEAMKGVDQGKDPNMITTTVGLLGQSGPAMLTGVLLMLAELSITFAIMLSPLFIFFSLFQQTSALFWSWAKFTLGALFSLATLTLIGAIALKATAVYGSMVVAAYYTNSGGGIGGLINSLAGGPFDISGSSMRLAALGTLMSAIIIAIPPTIMQFFSSGASFAAGAFGFAGAGALAAAGRSGSGATGGAATGLMNAHGGGASGSLSNQSSKSHAGATGNLGYNDSGNDGDMASANSQSLITRANGMNGGAGNDWSAGPVNAQGTRGLANQPGDNPNLYSLRHQQNSPEFKNSTPYSDNSTGGGGGSAKNSRADATLSAEDAVVVRNDNRIGRGGHLNVSGDSGSVGGKATLANASGANSAPLGSASAAASGSGSPAGASSPLPHGSSAASATPVHAAPDRVTASTAMPKGMHGRAGGRA